MKAFIKSFALLFLVSIALYSCRSEDMEIINTPTDEVFGVDSEVVDLLRRTSSNDGSYDNIIDGASCFDIKLPFTVIANGIEVEITDEDDIDIVEDIFDEFSDDTDTLEIVFPITIILDDYTEVVINSQAELNAAALQCPDPSEGDDDIECIDIQYPITAQIFNQNNELLDTVIINNDEELFDFLDDIDEDTIVTFDFPITVVLWDGTTVEIQNFTELVAVILGAIDQCDEDDDNDPNDDDCNECTTQQLTDVLTGCDDWMVDKLERNDNDLEDIYVGYLFSFDESGGITVDYAGSTSTGTWSASGSGNDITVTITIPDLPDFNDDWNLHEIEQQAGESKVDLRIGDDRLRFESDCISGGGGVDDTELVAALTNGDWYITYYFDDTDETADFADYVFNYATDGTATATDSNGTTNGTWSTSSGDETDLELNLNFGVVPPLDELAEDWDVLEVTNDIIRLKDESGDGTDDFLTFERTPFTGGGGGGSDLEGFLDDGNWFVASYLDDGFDETGDYAGYTMDFNATDGTVTATNGGNTNNGTWQVLSAGSTLLLDFGTDFPFDEFNDDWDVLSASETQVVLQDVSGGGGGTDTLTLQKL
ncbi:MAG: hypothetical protein AAFP76_10275 [Bacteroidota bacterium]